MSDDTYNPLLPSNTNRRFPYTYVVRYCSGGTETAPCGKAYTLQLDARSGQFVSASTHLRPSDRVQRIVTVCPKCGMAIDRVWLDQCYVDRPEPAVFGRDD